ncbi:hypothetical protein [Curtobacterium sp. Leaf261]|uniref:hypothetical protein n=1 Tax=Curtobacterium sp. Leaf261 TaxID=1736311 RepID=UPI0006F8069C|nr:hypothetical protein [Curtobacterium sp. Leaf261]KQO63054.1 hypothetical protein ASF23_09280 [Curtobacterium sp. Leaf261]
MFRPLALGALLAATLAGCGSGAPREDIPITPTNSDPAKRAFLSLDTLLDDTQYLVGGDWENVDSTAEECGPRGAQWVLSRHGPGMTKDQRRSVLAAIRQRWVAEGWDPTLSPTLTGSDSPGQQLRWPGSRSVEGGLFVELVSTVHGTTIFARTMCAEGDDKVLTTSRWSQRHTITPPYIPPTAPTTPTPTPADPSAPAG